MHKRALSLAAAVVAVLIVSAQFAQASVRDSAGSSLAALSAAINADLTGSQSPELSAATVEKSRAENSHADRVTVTTTVSTEVTTQADRENDPADVAANLRRHEAQAHRPSGPPRRDSTAELHEAIDHNPPLDLGAVRREPLRAVCGSPSVCVGRLIRSDSLFAVVHNAGSMRRE